MQSDDTRSLCRCGCGMAVRPGALFVGGPHLARRFTPEERFWLWAIKADGDACWEWIGWTDGDEGYGRFMVDGKRIRAHQFSWVLHFGPIPDGLDVLHKCDNPPCTRPDHLFVGTHLDNMRDKMAKGRGNHQSYPPEYYARGERASCVKLNNENVLEIRRLRSEGVSMNALGRAFGVNPKTIDAIVKRRTWVHI